MHASRLTLFTTAALFVAVMLLIGTTTAQAVIDDADNLYVGSGEVYTLGGVHSYNVAVEIAATGTLYIPAYDGSANTGYLEVSAPIINIDGKIDGEGRGYRGSPPPLGGDGEGPGGGSNPGGGGGYGGAGGASGWGNPGGPVYGTDFGTDIQMGSGGAHQSGGDGGNGGAMFKCTGNYVSITGVINCDGEDGEDVASMDGGGAGSGGGVYIQAPEIYLSGVVYARGGDGGDCLTRRGGGGGGGGRIKFFSCYMTLSGGNYVSLNGVGGVGSQTAYNGQPGTDGVSYSGTINKPSVTATADVTNDQGRQVRLSWSRSCLDDASEPDPVTHYTIWRRIDDLRATGDARATERLSYPPGDWDFVLDLPARGEDSYNAIVPTLADSNATGMHWSVFFVSGVTDNPFVYYDSAPDSGYSVDNLSPAAPGGFVLARVDDTNEMDWDESLEEDFAYYSLHRGESETFIPDAGNLVITLTGTDYDDAAPILSFYKLAAVDFNGNVSIYSLAPPDVTGVPEDELALALRVISPVSDEVWVEFVLPTTAPANIKLYDVAGRLIVESTVSPSTPGEHRAVLTSGSDIASGVYFIHLEQGGETRVGRVVVLR